MKKQTLLTNITYSLILLFFITAFRKLLNYQNFSIELAKSPIIGGYENFVAWLIPVFVILIGAGLIFKTTQLAALYASLALLTCFTGYIIVILNFADNIPCNCVGIVESLTWEEHLWFNIGLISVVITAIVLYSKIHRSGEKIFFGQETGKAENLNIE